MKSKGLKVPIAEWQQGFPNGGLVAMVAVKASHDGQEKPQRT